MAEITTLPPLTDDETTCLMIAATGQWLAPIGCWEKSILSLTEHGLMFKGDEVNYGITDAGKQALAAREQDDDRALGQALGKIQAAQAVPETVPSLTEQAANILADQATACAAVTGATPRFEAGAIYSRALELLR